MKYIKPLIVSAALALTLSSCQLSKWIPQKTEDPADMRAPAPTAKAVRAAKGSVEVFADDFEDDDE